MDEIPIPDPSPSILVSLKAILSAARSIEEAVRDLIGPVWSRLGYSGGRLWLLDRGTGVLFRFARWQNDPSNELPSANDRVFLIRKGQGLVGWAFERYQVEWMGQYAVSNGETRSEGRVCVPLRAMGREIGTLELVCANAREPTTTHLVLLEQAGRLLGEFLHRLGG